MISRGKNENNCLTIYPRILSQMEAKCGIINSAYMLKKGDANGDYDSIANCVHHFTLLSGNVSCFLFHQTVEQTNGADSKTTANEEEG